MAKQPERTGSLCFDKIVKAFRDKHSAFNKGKDGKWYFNFTQLVENDPDKVKYENDASFAFNSTSEKRDEEKKRGDDNFFGSAKKYVKKPVEPQGVTDQDTGQFDDLPF